jgi:hypothetical protein
MLCYRALGKAEEAAAAEAAYRKYQVDESAQAITQAFRLREEHVNRETNVLHVHGVPMDLLAQAGEPGPGAAGF